ncbi:hypothetical protein, partial [Agromyces humi]|uniref:hypothetical protein n=1 Tax=Agromyces humi TaxID=1766800 RepID=UPI001359C1FB
MNSRRRVGGDRRYPVAAHREQVDLDVFGIDHDELAPSTPMDGVISRVADIVGSNLTGSPA